MPLVLVYNAESGWIAALADSTRKVLAPQDVPCALCRLTHGAVGPRRAWRRFVAECAEPPRVVHRDERPDATARPAVEPPCVLWSDDAGAPEVLLDREAIAECSSVEALIAALQARLARRASAGSRPGP